ncbi:hypothetical protein COPG_00135 [Colwellia phage 9A]|uniref:Uncharacterized protein n=1 Tax=Colwellia phage 9A TaxID=765765 RepID=I3UML6_9CAUD|nr:hypothetical protein COPG_00135 [Colwellia phage 9A]AFK66731.1 hypothetical protein COPG_00135 [Colwellia phage 9A]
MSTDKSKVYTKMCSSNFSGRFIKNYFTPCTSWNDRQQFHGCFRTEDHKRFVFIESKICTHSDNSEERHYFLQELFLDSGQCLSPDEITAEKRTNKDLSALKLDMYDCLPKLIKVV